MLSEALDCSNCETLCVLLTVTMESDIMQTVLLLTTAVI